MYWVVSWILWENILNKDYGGKNYGSKRVSGDSISSSLRSSMMRMPRIKLRIRVHHGDERLLAQLFNICPRPLQYARPHEVYGEVPDIKNTRAFYLFHRESPFNKR